MSPQIRHLVFSKKQSVGIDFIDIDHHYTVSKKNLSAPHRASFFSILWLKTGTVVHQVDFKPIELQADTYLFVKKDAVQLFDQISPFTSQVLIFTDTFFCQSESDYDYLKSTPLFNALITDVAGEIVKASAKLKAIWQFMTDELARCDDTYSVQLLKNHLYTFLLIAERERNSQTVPRISRDKQFDTVVAFSKLLDKNFHMQKHVDFYAAQLAVTARVLTNATSKILGKTPKQLADERLLLEAKRLIIYGKDSGKAIALNLGFQEPTNFIKFFKNHTGVTPASFRVNYTTAS